MGRRDLLFIALVLAGLTALGASLFPALDLPLAPQAPADPASAPPVPEVVAQVDQAFRDEWAAQQLVPAARADDLAVARRLSLALVGSIPSLEEIRHLEADAAEGRLTRWTEELLADPRSADYLAERLARAYVGVTPGPFVLYRRHRFVSWLADRLRENTPYHTLVGEMIASQGLWTDRPSTNFLTVTIKPDTDQPPDPTLLAARISRAFLGIRLDCAECHDHPFADWKQTDFQGLAAYFGQVERGLTGLSDGGGEFRAVLHATGEERTVEPRVPFASEAAPAQGTRRQQLAAWVTADPGRAFARATVNRAWAMLFGRGLVEPIDDLPLAGPHPVALTLLADDFAEHGYDFRRLLRSIAALEVFALDSRGLPERPLGPEHQQHWAAFPLVRLRPEQVVAATYQAASLSTCDYQTHIVLRTVRALGQADFVRRFGDAGEDEFAPAGGTTTQRLLMLNGEMLHSATKPNPFNSASHLGLLARDAATAVEMAYLITLTRRPTPEEAAHFCGRLAGLEGEPRQERVSDLCWTLLNSTEFNWNH